MDEKKWWLVEGVIVEYDGGLYKVSRDGVGLLSAIGIIIITREAVPRGAPFDCMPDWTSEIMFDKDGSITYFNDETGNYLPSEDDSILPFELCPEEWKGKTFEITDELRGLLND